MTKAKCELTGKKLNGPEMSKAIFFHGSLGQATLFKGGTLTQHLFTRHTQITFSNCPINEPIHPGPPKMIPYQPFYGQHTGLSFMRNLKY